MMINCLTMTFIFLNLKNYYRKVDGIKTSSQSMRRKQTANPIIDKYSIQAAEDNAKTISRMVMV